jgi:aconitate hydratase
VPGQDAATLGPTGEEIFYIRRLAGATDVLRTVTVTAARPGGPLEFAATVRIDLPGEASYYRHGGILHTCCAISPHAEPCGARTAASWL